MGSGGHPECRHALRYVGLAPRSVINASLRMIRHKFHAIMRTCLIMNHVRFPTRAELSILRGSTEVGDPTSVTAVTYWGKSAAGVWSSGSTDPPLPVVQKWSPGSKRHKEKTCGEGIFLSEWITYNVTEECVLTW